MPAAMRSGDLSAGERQAALLSVAEMYRADARTIESGTPVVELMENAGVGVARAILARWPAGRVAVLCGPGNNGGDGFVVARHLKAAGWPVRLGLLGDPGRLTGDAAAMATRWDGATEPLSVALIDDAALVVDAIFGAGLARAVDGVVAELADAARTRGLPVCAVDVPSGVDGESGAVRGTAFRADLTVTFFRRKPGHLLLPGRDLSGTIEVVDIGIAEAVLDEIAPNCFANGRALWAGRFPWPTLGGHKYSRGHAVVVSGGPASTGAARLAASGALRAGAGLVTVASPPNALLVNAAQLTTVMTRPFDGVAGFRKLLADARMNAVLLGPGNGVDPATRDNVLAALAAAKRTVLDADALTVFQDTPEALFDAIAAPCVLTPHEGEFARLFQVDGAKPARAAAAARQSGAVVVLKGPDTVIAAPDGRVAINANAPAALASAGTGDVLAGFITGLLAAGMTPFDAACAGTWLHGAAGTEVGLGLIAEDLPDALPAVLRRLKADADD